MVKFSYSSIYSLVAPAIMRDRSPICRRGGCGKPRDDQGDGFCAEHAAAVARAREAILASAADRKKAEHEVKRIGRN